MMNRAADPNRRNFLSAALAAGAATVMPLHTMTSLLAAQDDEKPPTPDDPRIVGLKLRTAAPLEEMRHFYEGLLGLPVCDSGPRHLTLDVGASKLTFVEARQQDGKPWYHFGFNIPENKLMKAREWQLERTPLKQPAGPSTHDKYPDVADITEWNAHAISFWDPAGNEVEYIAHHDLRNARPGDFTPEDLLYISQIALMVTEVPHMGGHVHQETGWDVYRGATASYQPIGDARGMIVVYPAGENWPALDGSQRQSKAFHTLIHIKNEKSLTYRMHDHPFVITTDAPE